MVEIVKNKWRAFLKLNAVAQIWDGEKRKYLNKKNGFTYFDLNSHPVIQRVEDKDEESYTLISIPNVETFYVTETPEEIIEAADKVIEEQLAEKEKKAAEEAAMYRSMLEQRAEKTAKEVEGE